MTYRPWTTRERDYLIANYGRVWAHEIAAALDRTTEAVRKAAEYFGVNGARAERLGLAFIPFLIEKHNAGWFAAEIAKAWGCCKSSVENYRELLGLKQNANHRARFGQTMARARVRSNRTLGVECLVQRRREQERIRAHAAGWPPGCTAIQHSILDALERGPLTYREMKAATGTKNSFPTYIPPMIALGWVKQSGWKRRPDGVRQERVFALAITRRHIAQNVEAA